MDQLVDDCKLQEEMMVVSIRLTVVVVEISEQI